MNCEGNYLKEPHFEFSSSIASSVGEIYYDGYWQTPRYFEECPDYIREKFRFKLSSSNEVIEYLEKIQKTCSVGLHIRRGDYVNNSQVSAVHGVCSLDYYKLAVELILRENSSSVFYIFSDDLEWAKNNLDFIPNKIFIEFSETRFDWEEMFLYSNCSHNIIANSSFSWWGAWLNNNVGKIVIAPDRWFNQSCINTSDLYPVDWYRL